MADFSFDLLADAAAAQPEEGVALRIGSALEENGQILNHEARAARRLIKFFQDKPRIRALLAAFSAEVQELENVLWYYYSTSRDLAVVGGVLLDRLGALVNLPRAGRSDTDYRAAISVEVLVLASDGKPEQMYEIAEVLVPSAVIAITEQYPAAFSLAFSTLGTFTKPYILSIMRRAKPAGVRMDIGVAGGNIGSTDGVPAGGAIGSTDGVPLGARIGSA